MANSLRAKLSKLRHDGHITEEEYQAFVKKLDGHDRQQIPKEPIQVDDFGEYFKCPICDSYVVDNLLCRLKYCRDCGQAIKWE